MGYEIKYMDSSLADMVIIKEYLSQFYESTWHKIAAKKCVDFIIY
jgi:hypothetical protein